MAGQGAAGFWSYRHLDDEADEGRIQRLAGKVRAEFATLTGEELELFLDRDSLEWGAQWKARIDEALAGATFFIPILTPRYFQSQECRRELLKFVAEARRIGLEQLLLPVYWVPVRELDADARPEDEAMALVAQRQWEDLRDLRLVDEASADYRQAINRLASTLAEITEAVASYPEPKSLAPIVQAHDPESAEDDESPGLMELLAEGEAAIPRLGEILEELSQRMEEVSSLVEKATRDMQAADSRGGGFAGRLRVTERLAKELDEPAIRMADLGHRYAAELVKVDPLVLTLLDVTPADEQEAAEQREFATTIRTLAANAVPAAEALTGFITELREAGRLSRSIRRPQRKLQTGLQGVLDGQAVIAEWARRAGEA